MRLLLLTPRVDPNDDLFGHIHSWVTALSRRIDRLYVVALWSGSPPLPRNVCFASLGKGRTGDKAVWLTQLQRLVGRLCLSGEVDAVLAHMAPVFAVAAAPLARLTGRPLFLWYAHGHVSPMLRLAHRLVDGIGTSTPEGFRIPSRKVTITGQGIDTERFSPALSRAGGPPTVLSVGRFSPIKDYPTLLDGFARLPSSRVGTVEPTLTLLGGTHSQAEVQHFEMLRARADELGIAERVRFLPGLPYAQIADQYRRATLFATASRTGSLDKAVLEAASCGVLPLVCNEAFRGFLRPHSVDLSFNPGDGPGLATKLEYWLDRDDGERRDLALELRRSVEREHSVEHLAGALVRMIEDRP